MKINLDDIPNFRMEGRNVLNEIRELYYKNNRSKELCELLNSIRKLYGVLILFEREVRRDETNNDFKELISITEELCSSFENLYIIDCANIREVRPFYSNCFELINKMAEKIRVSPCVTSATPNTDAWVLDINSVRGGRGNVVAYSASEMSREAGQIVRSFSVSSANNSDIEDCLF